MWLGAAKTYFGILNETKHTFRGKRKLFMGCVRLWEFGEIMKTCVHFVDFKLFSRMSRVYGFPKFSYFDNVKNFNTNQLVEYMREM